MTPIIWSSTPEKIQAILELPHWKDERFRHLLTPNIWTSNIPNIKVMDNLLDLIFYCLQPIRNLIKKPMIITSGFRCAELNNLVCGAKNSQHTTGQAVDFIIKDISVRQIIDIIRCSNIPYDQLINEFDSWVHISFNKNNNRYHVLNIK